MLELDSDANQRKSYFVYVSDARFKFRFALLCAGFKSKSTKHAKYYDTQISCPSLHIFGESDKVIAGGMQLHHSLTLYFTFI